MIKPVDYTKQEHFTDPKQLTLTSKMELVIKGLVLCLIALAGVYQADAADAVLTLTTTGTINVGDTVTFTCTVATAAFIFTKGISTSTALPDSSRYTATLGVLTFVAKSTDTVAQASGWSCTGTTATGESPKVGLTIAPPPTTTTTTTTMKPTTACSGSGAEGINCLPLAVMIFAVLVSFFLRH